MSVPKTTEAMPSHYQALVENKLIFDSHGYVKRMTDGGFNEQQAETLAAEQAELLNNLATRQDMEGVRDELVGIRKDMRNMATKAELGEVRNELEEVKLNMATKAELGEVKEDLEEVKLNMATKAELGEVKEDLEEVKRNMATKQDLKLLRQENETLEANLRLAMKEDKVEMIKFMTWYFLSGLAVMAAMMTAMTAVIKLT